MDHVRGHVSLATVSDAEVRAYPPMCTYSILNSSLAITPRARRHTGTSKSKCEWCLWDGLGGDDVKSYNGQIMTGDGGILTIGLRESDCMMAI